MLQTARYYSVVAFVTAASAWMGSALAQTPNELDWCLGKNNPTPDIRINGCTAVIRSGKLTGTKLAFAFNNRGIAYKNKGETDRAIADYSEAIKLDPKDASAYMNRGLAYRQQKNDYDRAIEDYTMAIAANPKYDRAYDARCYARAVLGKLQLALADCTESLRLNSDAWWTRDSVGFIYLKMDRLEEAIKNYDAALKGNPKIPESLYGRGVAKLKKGDRVGGNADITAAQALNSNIAALMTELGVKAP